MKFYLLLAFTSFLFFSCASQKKTQEITTTPNQTIQPAAERLDAYIPLLKGKRVGVFANQTSTVGNEHLVDVLKRNGVIVTVIFGPEHGFRGMADAGEIVNNAVDAKTGIPVVSLYGNKKKPSAADVKNVDILLFDIQDVGVRFYTYINSLEDYMEAAAELHKPLILLDRPNPNGFYVDGPVLEAKYKSGIGRQPIPIVHGMTMGEYAMMLAGEKWLSPQANAAYAYYKNTTPTTDTPFHFLIIKCGNYTHSGKYELPVRPSPNLPNMQSIYLYPSTCLFEGTALSEGRGTNKPFQVFGHPSLPKNLYSFTPMPNEGAKSSKNYNVVNYGWDLSGSNEKALKEIDGRIQLKWLIEAYRIFPGKDSFFLKPADGNMEKSFINKLTGNNNFWKQIRNGASEQEIRKSWEPALSQFKALRKKYLLYEDF